MVNTGISEGKNKEGVTRRRVSATESAEKHLPEEREH